MGYPTFIDPDYPNHFPLSLSPYIEALYIPIIPISGNPFKNPFTIMNHMLAIINRH